MDRRGFLKLGAQLAGVSAVGSSAAIAAAEGAFASERHRSENWRSVLEGAPGDSGIDTVVIVMMENRSFDSYLGWLGHEKRYLERGRSRYGENFRVMGSQRESYLAPDGTMVETAHHSVHAGPIDDFRGCGHPDPGHGWNSGRAQRDGGFLAAGSGNDAFALSTFRGRDLPVYNQLAKRFTIADRWHSSLLAPTYPNRLYLLSGQSGGYKQNYLPFAEDGYQWPALFDRLSARGIGVADYASDFGPMLLFGSRAVPFMRTYADYQTDAAAGTLPPVTYVDPAFLGPAQNDDHPLADPRAGQQFILDTFRAFVEGPQWDRGLFIVLYDEWGGFFDHMAPPIVRDDRANPLDADNFGQTGFRVPAIMASPRSLPGFVDHARYDHASVLRFLEWRFLGAPPYGPHGDMTNPWWFTNRDRYAKNIGRTMSHSTYNPDPGFDLYMSLPAASPVCGAEGRPVIIGNHPFADAVDAGYTERIGLRRNF